MTYWRLAAYLEDANISIFHFPIFFISQSLCVPVLLLLLLLAHKSQKLSSCGCRASYGGDPKKNVGGGGGEDENVENGKNSALKAL